MARLCAPLEDDTLEEDWRRIHFDASNELCLFFDAHGCSIVDLRDEKSSYRGVETQLYVELGGALFGCDAPQNAECAFVSIDGKTFHRRVEELYAMAAAFSILAFASWSGAQTPYV